MAKMWLIILFCLFISSINCDLSIPLCPSGGQPVCAKSDYELIYFENECKLNVYSYKRLFAGKSRPTKIALEQCFSNCAGILCPSLYQPVCAQQIPEGTVSTVPNACLVNQLICETKKQWIIIGNGPCTSAAETNQSNYRTHAESAPVYETYESPSSHASQPESLHYSTQALPVDTAYHIPTAHEPASHSGRYTKTLLASAISSDKYTLAAYSAVPVKESGANSAPSKSYELSSSKSHKLSFASSSHGLSSAEVTSYHHSAPTPATEASPVAYSFAPSHHTAVVGSPEPAPIYEEPSESVPQSVPSHVYSPSVASPVSLSNDYAQEHHSPQESTSLYQAPSPQSPQSSYDPLSYPTTESPSSQYKPEKGYIATAPAPPKYQASSDESSYHDDPTYPAPDSKDYKAPQQTTPAHYENKHGLSHGETPQSGAYFSGYQGIVEPTVASYENPPTSDQAVGSYHAETPQLPAYSKDYETAAPSGSAQYETAQPSYVQPSQSHYDNSQPLVHSSHPPAVSYEAEIPQTSHDYKEAIPKETAHYESSQTSNDYETSRGHVPAKYESPHSTKQEDSYQSPPHQTGTAYPTLTDNYETSYQETETKYAAPAPKKTQNYVPALHSNDYQETAPTAQVHNENYVQDSADKTYPKSEDGSTHLVSPPACEEGDHSSSSHSTYQAPDSTPSSYHGKLASSEGHSTSPVKYSPSDENSAPSSYSSPASGDYYENPPSAPSQVIASEPVSYSSPVTASYPQDTSDSSYSLVVAPEEDSYTAPEVGSGYVSPGQEPAESTDAYSPTKQYIALDASQAPNSLPSHETYSASDSHPAPVAQPTSYSEPAQNYPSLVTSPAKYAPPHKQKIDAHNAPSLNFYLAPAPVSAGAPAPAVHVYTIPYQQPLSAAATSSHTPAEHTYSPASAPSHLPNLPQDLADILHENPYSVDFKHPPQLISESYDPKLADIVMKWIDSEEHSQYTTNKGHHLGGVPFYYQPSYTVIQYNGLKSHHSKK